MKVNHGPCVVCGKPILYLGCRYCGPDCNFAALAPGAAPAPPAPPEEAAPESEDRWLEEAVGKRLYL
jgi:hypothetical protein